MRREFEKWFKTSRSYLILKEANYFSLDLFEFNESYKRYVHNGIQIAFEAWQHQQSKVDELQLKLSEDSRILHNVIDIERKKNDEMQKRVDALTQVMRDLLEEMKYPSATFEEVICTGVKELEQALKGEQ